MSKFDNLYQSKFMKGLQRLGEKLAANKAFAAISQSFMSLMGIIMVGAVFQILASLPVTFGWWTTADTIYSILYTPYNMTMGLISVYFVVILSYNYAKALGLKPVINAIVGLALFLLISAPADITASTMSITYLGGTGLFVAIIVGLLSVKITQICEKKKIYIKMPEVVPPMMAESFASIVPMIINVVIFYGISSLISVLTGGALNLALGISVILSIPFGYLANSVIGIAIICTFACVFWTFGIHGTMVAYIAVMATMYQSLGANAAAVAAGNPAVFYPVLLFGVVQCAGGTGNTLSLCLMGLKSKSKQIQAVSRAAIVPGIFNINEPATFGYPVMYNPILAIPYILNVLVSILVVWLGYAIGFFQPAYITIGSLMPVMVGEFLSSMAWQNLLIPVVVFAVSFIIYLPFFKIYERQLIQKEAAEEVAETAK